MYTLSESTALADFGALPTEWRSKLSTKIQKASIVIALAAAGTAALTGALAVPQHRGRVAMVSGLATGLGTWGAATLIGRYAMKRADAAYDNAVASGGEAAKEIVSDAASKLWSAMKSLF